MSSAGHAALRLAFAVWLLALCARSFADFSTESHEIYSGDYNGDGLTDLYLKPKPIGLVLIPYEITIPITQFSDVRAVLLLGQSDGSFVVNYNLTSAMLAVLNTWTSQGYTLEAIDHDGDGSIDARIIDDSTGQPIAILIDTGGTPSFVEPIPGATVTYSYDDLGRLIEVTDSINGSSDYEYDAAGNRTQASQTAAAQ